MSNEIVCQHRYEDGAGNRVYSRCQKCGEPDAHIPLGGPEAIEIQRAACRFAASLLREVVEVSLFPNATFADAIASLERWSKP